MAFLSWRVPASIKRVGILWPVGIMQTSRCLRALAEFFVSGINFRTGPSFSPLSNSSDLGGILTVSDPRRDQIVLVLRDDPPFKPASFFFLKPGCVQGIE